MLKELFKVLDLNQKDQTVFTAVYRLGSNPASVIAKEVGLERTTSYRILKKLSKLGLISTTSKSNIQYFYVEDENTLKRIIKEKVAILQDLDTKYDLVRSELKALKPAETNPPQIKIYENSQNIFSDILKSIQSQNLTTIRLIASETFTEQTGPERLADIGARFLSELEKRKIKINSLIADGFLVKERLKYLDKLASLKSLPASNGASNIYLVGDTVFIVIFKRQTVGLQINHSDIAQILHFLFDQLASQQKIH